MLTPGFGIKDVMLPRRLEVSNPKKNQPEQGCLLMIADKRRNQRILPGDAVTIKIGRGLRHEGVICPAGDVC